MKHQLLVNVKSHFPTQYSQATYFGKLRNLLDSMSISQREVFKKLPWGHFAKIPEFQLSGQIVHMLLLWLVRQQPVDKLWFSIRGKIFKFMFKDFCEIINLSAYTIKPTFVKKNEKGSVANIFFKGNKRVSYQELKDAIEAVNPKKRIDTLAFVKLTSLFVVDGVLLTRDHDTKINADHFDWVEDFENFQKYPCALESYNLMVSNLKSLIRGQPEKFEAVLAKNPGYKNAKFTVWSLPHVLQGGFN
ncbi:unnamed protein product [Cuscuta europaea]|uniref:DUF1985 domain-containing protein n=1 Tax=Cuscuta europaea TaxID=41803 RepID=A0A9P0VW41_CUSEU|nr:unnamed protein product [Cuscuta europaea]